MYIIAACGLVMFLFCLAAFVAPKRMSNGIITFSEKSYFHWFEVISRMLLGLVLIYFSPETAYPQVFLVAGYVVCAVSMGLILYGEARHKAIAVKMATDFAPYFRWIGLVTMPLGLLVIYGAVVFIPCG